MPSLYTVIAFATAIAALPAAVEKRDVTTVLGNLDTIDADTDTLTATINAWDSSLLGALGINSDVSTVESAVTSATTEAETEAQADDTDSEIILDYISETLGPDIFAALDALTAREADFAAIGTTSLVLSDLETLKTDVDALGSALVKIASTDTQADAETIVAEVDAAFESAIAVFS